MEYLFLSFSVWIWNEIFRVFTMYKQPLSSFLFMIEIVRWKDTSEDFWILAKNSVENSYKIGSIIFQIKGKMKALYDWTRKILSLWLSLLFLNFRQLPARCFPHYYLINKGSDNRTKQKVSRKEEKISIEPPEEEETFPLKKLFKKLSKLSRQQVSPPYLTC